MTVAGIPIRLHLTFLLVLSALFLLGGGTAGSGVLFFAALFGCVLLHELGHALMARRFGIGVREIVLYPIGGVARLTDAPTPKQELWVTAAGPAVNVALAAALFAYLAVTGQAGALTTPGAANFAERLLFANVALFAFNLLPAFPLDGGRLLRAGLALRIGEERATRFATTTGRLIAVGLGLFGVFSGNLMLAVIAFLIFSAAGQEAAVVQSKALVERLPARAAMVTDVRTLSPGVTLGEASGALLTTSQTDFPVLLGDQVVGVLTRRALVEALGRHGPNGYVSGAMAREFVCVRPDDDLGALLSSPDGLLARPPHLLVVEDEAGRLTGLVTPDNLAELFLLRRVAGPAGLPPAHRPLADAAS